jgi:hypothetical protein
MVVTLVLPPTRYRKEKWTAELVFFVRAEGVMHRGGTNIDYIIK